MNAPTPSSTAPSRAAGASLNQRLRDDASPPGDAKEAFAHALLRLQRRERNPAEEAAAAMPAEAAAPLRAHDPRPGDPGGPGSHMALLAAGAAAGPAAALPSDPSGLQARLTPDEVYASLSSLRVPAAPQGPQQWQFLFGSAQLPVQGLTLTGLPGGALQLQLHAGMHLPPRERDAATQRLAELRQRLGERGTTVRGLDWAADPLNDSFADADPGDPR